MLLVGLKPERALRLYANVQRELCTTLLDYEMTMIRTLYHIAQMLLACGNIIALKCSRVMSKTGGATRSRTD
eukprot:6212903-Pleurochrysis_carterae.AAC.3